MPIVVACPNCPTKLSAPESAAGKQVRCPKCGAAAPVPALIPAEEEPVVDAALAPPKPKPKPVQAEADEEERPRKRASREEDDEEEAPRKKKKKRYADDDDDYDHDHARRKRRPQKGGGAMLAVAIGGGLVLLIAVGVVIWLVRGKDSPLAKKTPVPPGWKQYSYPQDGFKAYFPSEPQVMTNTLNLRQMEGRGGFPGGVEVAEMTSVSSYVCGGPFAGNNSEVQIIVAVARFRDGVPRSMRDQMGQMTSMKMGKMETRRVRWLGHDAGELVVGNTLMRIVYTDDAMITVQISGPKGARAKPEEEAGFFDNFELTK